MTDYFGQVVELDVSGEVPTLDITDDRADALWIALEKLGFPLGRTADVTWEEILRPLDSPAAGMPSRVRIAFPQEIDLDGLQDLLDELDYRADGMIVREVV